MTQLVQAQHLGQGRTTCPSLRLPGARYGGPSPLREIPPIVPLRHGLSGELEVFTALSTTAARAPADPAASW